jgi:hypothetical protein
MNYAARLSKIEKLAGKVACPSCRLHRRHSWLDSTKPRPKPKDPALSVTVLCEECGAPANYDLSGYPEDLREIVRLYCTSKRADTYTNPRAWAALRWMIYRGEAQKQQRKALREMQKLSAPGQSSYQQQQQEYARRQKAREREQARTKDPDAKLYHKLLAEMQAQSARRHRRLERQHGENPFPELDARLDAVQKPDYGQLYKGEPFEHDISFLPMFELEREAKLWMMCAELEKIVLGDVTAHTTGKLADCERRAGELIAAGRAKHEAREEKRRQDEAERERQRLEREAASRPATPQRDVPGYYQTARHSQELQSIEIPPDNKPAFFDPFSDDDAFLSCGQPPDPLAVYVARWGNRPPPDDGTLAYQRRLAHWKGTGEWLPDARLPRSW